MSEQRVGVDPRVYKKLKDAGVVRIGGEGPLEDQYMAGLCSLAGRIYVVSKSFSPVNGQRLDDIQVPLDVNDMQRTLVDRQDQVQALTIMLDDAAALFAQVTRPQLPPNDER